eukprot:385565-Karenia_brevis.AAC.1
MWVLPYSQDTIDTNLADEEGAAEMVLLHMRNRRNVYAHQNPDMTDIFLSLSWHLHVVDAPPSTDDRPSSTRIRLDEEIRTRYENGLISGSFLMS